LETIVTRLEDNQLELKVTIPAEQVDAAVKAAYAEANKNRIKGFRVGKAPRNVLDKVYGGPESFLAEATDDVIKASYLKAIDAEDIVALDTPDLGEPQPVVEGQSYEYSMIVNIAPEYELDSYEPLVIELPSEEPTPEEVQERIDTMMGYYVEYLPVEDRPSQVGDILTLDMEVTQDGERVESLSGESVPYELGIAAMPEGFEESFIGISPGDEVSVDFTLPYYDLGEDSDEQPLHAEARLLKIEERHIPELTDEWVSEKLEYESADYFRELLTDSLRASKKAAIPELKERRVAEAVGRRLQGEPPALMVAEFSQDIYRSIFNSLQSQGVTLDVFLSSNNQTPDEFREDVQRQAEENARQAMALDAWARHAGLEASDEDILEEFGSSGVDDPEAVYQSWVDAGRISEIRQGIRRMKASRQLGEEALVVEEAEHPEEEPEAPSSPELILPETPELLLPETPELILPGVMTGARDDEKKSRKAESKSTARTDGGAPRRASAAPQAQKRTGGPKKV